jgi:dodecin
MAGKSTHQIVEIVGTSKTSWEEAAKIAVETAGKSLQDRSIVRW